MGRLSPKRTVLRVSVARSARSVRKLCTGWPSSVSGAGLGRRRRAKPGGGDGEVRRRRRPPVVILEQQRRQLPAHVPWHVVGEHAEKDMRPHPAGEPVMDGTDSRSIDFSERKARSTWARLL